MELEQTKIVLPGRTFTLKVVENIDSLLNSVETDDDIPFWAIIWPAAVALSEYIWAEIDFTKKRVLELGAGLGLVGIVAAAKNADLVQTDFSPEALRLAQNNAQNNGIHNITHVLADWRDFHIREKFDWIFGSDILYEPKLHSFLKNIFTNNLKPEGTVVLADPGREDGMRFIKELKLEGYKIKTINRQVYESGRNVKVSLYFLKKGF